MPKDKKRPVPSRPKERVEPSPVSAKTIALDWTKSIAIAIGLALLIRWPVAEPFKIPSGSMEPTFYAGDRIFVDKHVYGVRYPFNGFRIPFTRTTFWYSEDRLWSGNAPQRWDIVVFKSVEPNAEHDTLVKRIVGLPGERVRIRGDGKIYINGEAAEIPPDMPPVTYTFESLSNGYGLRTDDAHALVPENHYFLLGDNSGHSRDARWFGWVPDHHILGRVSSIWWPVGRWRDLTGFSASWWWWTLWTVTGGLTLLRLFVGRSCAVADDLFCGALRENDHVFVRFSPGLTIPFTRRRITPGRDLRRGEVVAYYGDTQRRHALLGIVIGLPGERVYIHEGELFVNDAATPWPELLGAGCRDFGGNRGPFGGSKGKDYSLVPEGHYYVLVDDASSLADSRNLGWIARGAIIGSAGAAYWPLGRRRRLPSA